MVDAFELLGELRPRAGAPAYHQIEQRLADAIVSGELSPGDRLPSEREFASALGVSRMTLRQALAALEKRGLVERTMGRYGGTFVVEPRVECDLTGVMGLTDQLRRHQMRPGARVVHARRVAATAAVAEQLELPPDEPVFDVTRVRLANRQPLALERSFFPVRVFPDLLDQRLTGSLYALIERRYGHRPVRAYEAMIAVVAGTEEAATLQVEVGDPLMLVERTAYARSGLPLEYATDLFRGDRTRITVWSGELDADAPSTSRASGTVGSEIGARRVTRAVVR